MHKILKSLLMTVVLSAASLGAHAAPVDLSHAPVDLTQDLIDYSSGELFASFRLGAGQLAGAGNNFFSDKFLFTLTGAHDFSGLATSLKPSANSGLTLTGFSLSNASGVVLHGALDLLNFTAQDQAWVLNSGKMPLLAGTYFLQVDGYVASASGGSYSGNVSASAVPEADAYAMLLAGLGLMGFVARRRKLQA
ncbi:FxDxF family PEP-CTERM protein [Janthinobacterium sp. TND4EL3]|uniref:FxDxF family PEP-CTERM protein n=1 Tax=Janthinobacterium sp. TND4EL3 TaxID=1907311 RepID=UPI0009FB7A99|nr:FxDxF family PEP-CTERM protein [Janthinobacterium sp. TND4EL3]